MPRKNSTNSKTKLDKQFEDAVAPRPRFVKFFQENEHLVPYIWAYEEKRNAGERIASLPNFYQEFLKPNGITVSESHFLSVYRIHFRGQGGVREGDQA